MNNLIKIQDKTYELAASAMDGNADIYGQTLHEICRFHELSIQRVKSPDLRAIEQGKYALFMLSQIMNFAPSDHVNTLKRIILLCDCAIDTLIKLEGRNTTYYSVHISACRKCRGIAAELHSMR